MRSFVTGSHAYGLPTEKSDIDLVVWVSPVDLHRLQRMADNKGEGGITEGASDGGPEADSLRFGKLNLIAVTWKKAFQAWLEGTEELMNRHIQEQRDIPRDEAIKLFKKLRKKLNKALEKKTS